MKLRPFELALVVIFLVMGVVALGVLSSYKPKKDNDGMPEIGTIDIWGTLPAEGMDKIIFELGEENDEYRGVHYRYIRPEDFQNELVYALADGTGPDIVLIEHERLVELRSKIRSVSYESFPERDIRSRYIDGAQVFALNDGLYAYPVLVDPLMLYWNRDILAGDNIIEPPATWEALVNDQFAALIRRNPDRSIDRAVVGMGEYNNVKNAFGIISMLLLQAGTAGVRSIDGNYYEVYLNRAQSGQGTPLMTAVEFYTRFSKPTNALYTWNRSFTEDKAQFLGEKAAFYFGFASEGIEIERQNPNLNFDIAEVPQGEKATVKRTYGKHYGLAALRSSDNLSAASYVMSVLAADKQVQRLADEYHMVPASRSLAAVGSNDTYGRLAYKSAAIAYGWLSPGEVATDRILETLTKDINENRQEIGSATADAVGRLELEYR